MGAEGEGGGGEGSSISRPKKKNMFKRLKVRDGVYADADLVDSDLTEAMENNGRRNVFLSSGRGGKTPKRTEKEEHFY